jgi:carboxymethylenebutenolidase
LAAFAASPDYASGIGVVILPDVRGLYRFYEELALRFAERGHNAVAIDYFGRTAGVGKRDEDFRIASTSTRRRPRAFRWT